MPGSRRWPAPLLTSLGVTVLAAACASGPVPAATGPAATAPPTAAAPTDAGSSTTAAATPPPPGSLPAPPSSVPASAPRPGDVVSADPIPAPAGGRAWRIVYRSTGAAGGPVLVTGQLLVPDRPPPAGGFPLVTFGHATTGTADQCAPSSQQGTGALPFPADVLGQGWAIVATDYEGLGGPGPHPYLVGASEGASVLDAARAASRLTGSGVMPTSPVTIWGFSQGGHAGAFAAQLAPSYAPELDLRAAVLVAPVADVTHFAQRAERIDTQFGVLVVIARGMSLAAGGPALDRVFGPAVTSHLDVLEQRCIVEANDALNPYRAAGLRTLPSADPAFAAAFAANRAGDAPSPVPVLLVQGLTDDLVEPADTRALRDRWCAAGGHVEVVERPGMGHGVMTPWPVVPWTAARLAGEPLTTAC